MPSDPQPPDCLDEIRELNRLFLSYARACAREDRPCMGLPRPVSRRLAEAPPGALERIADLPAALFRLNLEPVQGTRDRAAPERTVDRMRLSLALTILNSAWHMARERTFEARMFLRLSEVSLRRLRIMPLSSLPDLASAPELLTGAFAGEPLTWRALFRDAEPETARMLTLIALQPTLAPEGTVTRRAGRRAIPSFR